MIYSFDKNELTYKNVTTKMVSLFVLCCVLITLVVSCIGIYLLSDVRYITEEMRLSILKEKNEFSADKLKTALVDLNVKFPHIVYAQARLETGNFTSKIFKENNNLFGMREATVRPTTNKGTENNHAYFDNWYDSVLDYAMYSASYLSDIKTEDEYLQYLKQNYAEDPNYMEALLVLLKE
jgi:hypothetical protein